MTDSKEKFERENQGRGKLAVITATSVSFAAPNVFLHPIETQKRPELYNSWIYIRRNKHVKGRRTSIIS